MNKKTLIILIVLIAAILLIALGVGGYIYWNKWKKLEAGKNALEKAGSAVEKIIEGASKGVLPSLGVDPLEDKPDINPADKANPFKNIKTNPFE
ncbi:hypothetical protein KJ786_01320 [Patescibacteria group bacterium]|nr:hypothetical protein [Patescibacteria group bacterium]